MFYRLREPFILRGWEKLNAVLIKRPKNQYKALTSEEFSLLMLCDGETDFTNLPLTDRQRQALKEHLQKGTVTALSEPSPLSEDQLYRRYPNRFVRSCFWSVTGRCNFRCRHCYMDAPEGALGELPPAQAAALIDQMADCGVLRVDITGGEPFVRADFWELIDRILQHKITIGQVYTNGLLLTDEVLEAFEQRGLQPEFCISFDGLGRHDWMRGVRGAEDAALDAIKRCRAHGFSVLVQVCVHRGNLAVLRETVKYLANIGVSALKIGNVSQTALWRKNSEGNDLTQQEYADAILAYIPQFFEDGMPVQLMIGGVISLHKGKTDYQVVPEKFDGTEGCLTCHLCGAARYSCYITPEGRLLPCMPMTACKEQELFPLFQDIGLQRALHDSFYMQFVDKRIRDLLAVNEKCGSCPHQYKCGGGCRASALQQSGHLLGEDAEQCFLWENGYVEKIHRVAEEAIVNYCKKGDADDEN